MANEIKKIGDILLKKEDYTATVTTKRGIFVLKVADPLTKRLIIRNISTALNHAPLTSVQADDYLYIKACETLRQVIIDAPDWWEGVDSCMDDDLIITLYSEYLKLEENLRRCLRGNRYTGSGKTDKPT